jgi:hypothetical protein
MTVDEVQELVGGTDRGDPIPFDRPGWSETDYEFSDGHLLSITYDNGRVIGVQVENPGNRSTQ